MPATDQYGDDQWIKVPDDDESWLQDYDEQVGHDSLREQKSRFLDVRAKHSFATRSWCAAASWGPLHLVSSWHLLMSHHEITHSAHLHKKKVETILGQK